MTGPLLFIREDKERLRKATIKLVKDSRKYKREVTK